MPKHQPSKFFLVIMAIVAQACTPNATQGPETINPVSDAQQTLAAATQQGLTALAFAQETIAAAYPSSSADDPVSMPPSNPALLNDQSIEAHFTGQVVCSQFEINLTNGSTTTFKSMSISISVKDDPSSLNVTSSTNGFLGHDSSQTNTNDNCELPTLSPSLDPGASYTVFFPKFTEKSSTFEGSVVLCPENNLGGQCSKNSIVFPPNMEPGPSPTPESISSPVPLPLAPEIFTADYVNTVHPCSQTQTWWVRVSLTNKFNSALKSMSISVKDTATGDISSESDEHLVFVDLDQSICNPDIDVGTDNVLDDLEPNQSFTVSSGVFRKDPTEHPMEATLTLCTEEGLQGQCNTKTINFTPSITAQPTPDTTKPTFPYIILSAGTNCRTGPGTQYDVIGAYAADTKIPVLGKDPSGKYWLVESPYRNDNYPKCWLDGRFVKESGNLGNVAVYPVPPTPTPKPPTSTPTLTATATATPTP